MGSHKKFVDCAVLLESDPVIFLNILQKCCMKKIPNAILSLGWEETISIAISPIPQTWKFRQRHGKFWSELIVPEKASGCQIRVLVKRWCFCSWTQRYIIVFIHFLKRLWKPTLLWIKVLIKLLNKYFKSDFFQVFLGPVFLIFLLCKVKKIHKSSV